MLSDQNKTVKLIPKQFVVITPYQFEGDTAFGVWVDEYQRYLFGDGDCYSADELLKYWPNAELLTWSQLEKWLKKPSR